MGENVVDVGPDVSLDMLIGTHGDTFVGSEMLQNGAIRLRFVRTADMQDVHRAVNTPITTSVQSQLVAAKFRRRRPASATAGQKAPGANAATNTSRSSVS